MSSALSSTGTDAGTDPMRRGVPLQTSLPGLALLFRRLPWALLAAVLGLAVGAGVGQVRDRVYESTTYVTVTAQAGTADASSLSRAAQGLARIATAPEVISGPLRDAGLADAARQPRLFIMVEAAPDAPLISITGVASSARDAQTVAATVADTLGRVHTLGPFRAFSVADPPLPSSPSTPVWLLPAGGAGLGLTLGLVLAATVPARRPRGSRNPVAQA
jgi:hypothetical protein